jgi:hypothetical protein
MIEYIQRSVFLLCVQLVILVAFTGQHVRHPPVHVMVLYSSQGNYGNLSGTIDCL